MKRMQHGIHLIAAGSLVFALAGVAFCQYPASTSALGLSVHNGVLMREGVPYQGMGANYFSLFMRALKNPDDNTYEAGLRQLAEAGIPFVRFMACGFWPIDWDLYLRDKEAYFKRLDGVVAAAEKHTIGLIPSLFWHVATVPDLVGEPVDCLGDPQSKTIAFIRQYTMEVVTRYRHSKAIWGWEFGNEYNLAVDLPNAAKHRPPVWPKLKTATQRTERDALSSKAMLTAFDAMAKTVRHYDPQRVLITGNAVPRPYAYHNTLEKSWKRDTAEQWLSVLMRDNPAPFDTLCVHIYPDKPDGYPLEAKSPEALIAQIQRFACEAKKPLFVGEFGAPCADAAVERATFTALVNALETNQVPLSAFWVFDYSAQDKDWNVTFSNPRAYMLQCVGAANRRMQATAKETAHAACFAPLLKNHRVTKD